MKARLGLAALALAFWLTAGSAWAAGEFYVIAGSGPPVGTKITSLPYTISNAGFYFLGGNLTTSGDGIVVGADDVTIDLMGCSLTHTGAPGASNGILMEGRSNVEIRNGTVRGFYYGIWEAWSGGANHRVINVRALNNSYCGIYLTGTNHLVRGCTAANVTNGICVIAGTITDCVACGHGNEGISLAGTGSAIGNVANNNTVNGFSLGTGNIVVDRNSASDNGANYYGGPSNPACWGLNAGR